jgi:hypothetical protein
VTKVNGRQIEFTVRATDGAMEIGIGSHSRVVACSPVPRRRGTEGSNSAPSSRESCRKSGEQCLHSSPSNGQIRGITDAADKEAPQNFDYNLPIAMGNLFWLLEALRTGEN